MAVSLNHTIVHAPDALEAATFATEILGLDPPKQFAHFQVVELSNGVSLDYATDTSDYLPQHYAFLITEEEFDEVFARITEREVPYFADPMGRAAQQINHGDGGRGCYFQDPAGHWLEILTRPYGSSLG